MPCRDLGPKLLFPTRGRLLVQSAHCLCVAATDPPTGVTSFGYDHGLPRAALCSCNLVNNPCRVLAIGQGVSLASTSLGIVCMSDRSGLSVRLFPTTPCL